MKFYCISQVTRRVGDVTGLDMATAEDLQVVNYGIGGHYEPHFDYARVYFLFYLTISRYLIFLAVDFHTFFCVFLNSLFLWRFAWAEAFGG